MPLTGFHLRVAGILGETLADEGFALGGGYGLQTHQLADRPSEDLDSYVNKLDADVFTRAEEKLTNRLHAEGFTVEVTHRDTWFRGFNVTGPGPDESVRVDLGYDYRTGPPVNFEGLGPVLRVDDVIAGKVRAFIERGAERDYSDIDTILQDGRWNIAQLYQTGRELFPDLTPNFFAEQLTRVGKLDQAACAKIGIEDADLTALRSRLTQSATSLLAQRHGPADECRLLDDIIDRASDTAAELNRRESNDLQSPTDTDAIHRSGPELSP